MKLSTEFKNIAKQSEKVEQLNELRADYQSSYELSNEKLEKMIIELLTKINNSTAYPIENNLEEVLKLSSKDKELFGQYLWLLGDGSWS